ncbi:hypothetical protein Tco_0081195, partial [Tanacetum coccineum]
MSPFLFILAMEGLHALTYKAEALGLFKGASIGQDNMSISHLIYVDDVIFFGVGVTDDEVSHMANIIGCGATKFPLKYSGRLLSVSGHLSLIKSVLGNLPTFYMSIYLLSISIRKKLESLRNKFFTGGDPDDTKMTWVKWKRSLVRVIQCIHSLEGGINVVPNSSLKRSTWGSIISSINSLKHK